MMPPNTTPRRAFLKTVGITGASSIIASGPAAAGLLGEVSNSATGGVLNETVDDVLDPTSDVIQEALIVFDARDDVSLLDTLGIDYYAFEVLPIAYVKAAGPVLSTVADLASVRSVEANRELDYFNADTRSLTGVNSVQSDYGYTGETVHAAVIDTGVDGSHPDLGNVERSYQWVGSPLSSPTLFLSTGSLDTDETGHGTHVSGTVGGSGAASDGRQRGMAPDVTLTVYSTSATVSVLKVVAAYDHLLATHMDEVDIVSNSYGRASGADFDPDAALNTATHDAYHDGILSVFAAGNSGPATNTLNDFAKAPYVLGAAAVNDSLAVTDFSSRGRVDGFYDRDAALSNLADYTQTGTADGPVGIYRPSVVAPGDAIVSTMSPADPLQVTGNIDTDLYYGVLSGTSMSCPAVVGIAALLVDAYKQNNDDSPTPIDVITTIEAAADSSQSGYTPYNAGTGCIDADAAVARAEAGDLATFDDVSLSGS